MIYKSNNILPIKDESIKDCYFLAGSIDFNQSDNWRKTVIQELEYLVDFFDPTNENHNRLNNVEMKEHIDWELNALNLSDKIIINFLPDYKSPISLVELGLYSKSKKLVVVCPEQFYQNRYVKVLCEKYGTPFFNNLYEAIQFLKKRM